MATTQFLQRPEGRIAYEVVGDGPMVLCIPGMGDLRGEYRLLTPLLVDSGYRVVTMDLRGHGESDATFPDYERPSAGDDVVGLLEHLSDPPAHVVGCSYGAAAAVWAAATTPAAVASLTLIGPFVRAGSTSRVQQLALSAMLRPPWGSRAWSWWYRRLYPGSVPADFDHYLAALRDSFSSAARMTALRAMALSSSAQIDPLLDTVAAPSLVIMGTADPDFPDPAAEAQIVADRLRAMVTMVDGAGHYPHAQQPDETAGALVPFLDDAGPASGEGAGS